MLDKTFCFFVLLFALGSGATRCYAQDSKYAGAFLEIPVGARAQAMGGAFTAIANDESAFHWNPAGVSLSEHKLVGFMYSSEYGLPGSSLANFWHIGFTLPMQNVTLSANWVRLSVGDLLHTPDLTTIEQTGERQRMVREIFGGTPDYFSDNEDALVLSIARNTKFTMDWGWLYYKHEVEVPVGINFKLIHQGIGNFGSAQGIGIDAGAMVRFSLADFLQTPYLGKLSVGAAITDIAGTSLHWSTQRKQLIPMHLNGGLSYTHPLPFMNAVATFSSDVLIGEREKPRFGLDFLYKDNLSLRMGLNQGLFATGAGFNWDKKIDLNYSLAINTALGPEHRLSFSIDVDNILNPQPPKEEKQ